MVQIVVYSGAIMALYAFGMMFFDTTRDVSEKMRSKKIAYTLSVISAILVVTILCAPLASEEIEAMYPSIDTVGNVQMIGVVLFTKYLVPFELAAIMLLVAMIAGIVLASKRMDEYLAMEENEIEYPKETK